MIKVMIWILCAVLFGRIGLLSMRSEEPVKFLASEKPIEVRDVKAYNCAVGKMLIGFAVIFALLGLPMLKSELVFIGFSVVGVIVEIIVVMILYRRIKKKYAKK
ncbi:MAG: hypothetical protein LUE11_09925 [Clostridia bacterium]|nr:hypothetical protein [Clostridia bacterium]